MGIKKKSFSINFCMRHFLLDVFSPPLHMYNQNFLNPCPSFLSQFLKQKEIKGKKTERKRERKKERKQKEIKGKKTEKKKKKVEKRKKKRKKERKQKKRK